MAAYEAQRAALAARDHEMMERARAEEERRRAEALAHDAAVPSGGVYETAEQAKGSHLDAAKPEGQPTKKP